MRAATLKDGSNTGQEFLLGLGGDEDVIHQLNYSFQASQGLICALAKPVTRGAKPHWSDGVGITSPRKKESCQELALRGKWELEVTMYCIQLAKPPVSLLDHFANCVRRGEWVNWTLDVLVELDIVSDQADLVWASRLGDEMAPTQPRCCGVFVKLENDPFFLQFGTEGATWGLQVSSHRSGISGMVGVHFTRLEANVQGIADHTFVRRQIVVQDVWKLLNHGFHR